MTGKQATPLSGSGLPGNRPGYTTVPASVPAIAVTPPAATGLNWIETLEDLLALEKDWLALEEAGASPQNFFQSFAWCSAWAKIYLKEDPGTVVKTIVARENGTVVMIWPLMVVRQGPMSILKWMSDPVGQYGDVLIGGTTDRDKWLTLAWSRITADPDIDGIALQHVREDANAFEFLCGKCAALNDVSEAPQLDLTVFSSADDYSAALSRNQRSQRSKLRKKLEKDGAVSFDVHRGDDAFRHAVKNALAYKSAWLEERGLKADIIGDPRFEELITKLGSVDENAVATGVLSAAGTPLSIDVAFTYKGRYFGCVISENPDSIAKSPTKVHLDLRQKACVDDGFSEFDMMLPTSPFKAHWTNQSVAVRDFSRAMNLWGLLYCSVYLGRLRPAMKRLYYAVGTGPRTAILGILRALRGAR